MPKLSRKAKKPAKRKRMHEEMTKFAEGKLHSGAKKGPVVSNRKQAIAIGMSQAGMSRKKVGKKRRRKGMRKR